MSESDANGWRDGMMKVLDELPPMAGEPVAPYIRVRRLCAALAAKDAEIAELRSGGLLADLRNNYQARAKKAEAERDARVCPWCHGRAGDFRSGDQGFGEEDIDINRCPETKWEGGKLVAHCHERCGRVKAEAKVERLLSALAFYADSANWMSQSTGFALQYDPKASFIEVDRGRFAREALEKEVQK